MKLTVAIAVGTVLAAISVAPASASRALAGSPPRNVAAGVVNGCVNLKTRALTIPKGTANCRPGTRSLSWQVTGPAGPDGVPGWGLTVPRWPTRAGPLQIAFDGIHLWATNKFFDQVVEVNPDNRTITLSLDNPLYGFEEPTAMAVGGGDLWVLNSNRSVTELRTSNGAFLLRLSGARYGFSDSGSLLVADGHLWVTDPAGNSVTEINASNGVLVRKLSGGKYGFKSPSSLTFAHGDIWVANPGGNSVTEFSARNGAFVRRLTDPAIKTPVVLAVAGGRLWVLSQGPSQSGFGSATEVNPGSGAIVRRIAGQSIQMGTPDAAVAVNGRLWIANAFTGHANGAGSVVEIGVGDGTFKRKIPGTSVDNPMSLTSDGTHVWIAGGQGLSEFPADGTPSGPAIAGCVNAKTRALTIPAAGTTCGHGTARISWLRDGPAGHPGANGWPNVISGAADHLASPSSVIQAGSGLWILNPGGNTITEVGESDGTLTRVLTASRYKLSAPIAAARAGISDKVWVVNARGNSVSEINDDKERLVRVVSGARYGFDQPIAVAAGDRTVYVVNAGGNSITEINARDGSLVRVISAAADHFRHPIAIANDGIHLWVANANGNSVTELNTADGSLVRTLSTGYGFGDPDAITTSNGDVWVASKSTCAVTEINASDGGLIRTIPLCQDLADSGPPVGISAASDDVYVTESGSNTVAEIDATTGVLVRQIGEDGDGFDFDSVFPAGLLALGGTVFVTNPGSDTVTQLPQRIAPAIFQPTIQACLNGKTRAVTVPDPLTGENCPSGASKIDWAIPGPSGQDTASDLAPVFSSARYQFDDPSAVAGAGDDLWVANAGGNSVTEVSASDGTLLRNVQGLGYAFSKPMALAVEGDHLWVANAGGNSVTEIDASDGTLLRNVQGPGYAFNKPNALAVEGDHLWVANAGGNSVTEINLSDGSLVSNLSGGSYQFDEPDALAFDGSHLWIANAGGDSLTEINASDGSFVRNVGGTKYRFDRPDALLFDGTLIWAAGIGADGPVEINASDGSLARSDGVCDGDMVLNDSLLWIACVNGVEEFDPSDGALGVPTGDSGDLGLLRPSAIAVAGGHVWVVNFNSLADAASLTELPLS